MRGRWKISEQIFKSKRESTLILYNFKKFKYDWKCSTFTGSRGWSIAMKHSFIYYSHKTLWSHANGKKTSQMLKTLILFFMIENVNTTKTESFAKWRTLNLIALCTKKYTFSITGIQLILLTYLINFTFIILKVWKFFLITLKLSVWMLINWLVQVPPNALNIRKTIVLSSAKPTCLKRKNIVHT